MANLGNLSIAEGQNLALVVADGNICNTASTATGSEAIALGDADIAGATCVTPVVETSILQIDPSLQLRPAIAPIHHLSSMESSRFPHC